MLYNKTKRTIIAENPLVCATIWSKAKGFMFTRKYQQPLLFIFSKEQYVPLHMYFVRFSLDILYINSKQQIVEIKENLKPWQFYHPKQKAMYVVELKQGVVKEKKIDVGDVIEW